MRSSLRVVAVVSSLVAVAAWPCRGPFRSLEENVKSADVVAVAVLVSTKVLGPNAQLKNSDDIELTFTVVEVLKGKAGKALAVRSDTTTCGFGRGVMAGKRVLVFASGTPLATGATSGNLWLEGPEAESSIEAVRQALKSRR